MRKMVHGGVMDAGWFEAEVQVGEGEVLADGS